MREIIMNEREEHGSHRREFKAGDSRGMAKVIYSVARFIQQKDYFGGFQIDRRHIENTIGKPAGFSRKGREKLRESVYTLILCLSYDDSIIKDRSIYRVGRREKFSFKQDEDFKAKYCELLAFFGEKAGIDPQIIERHRAEAADHWRDIG